MNYEVVYKKIMDVAVTCYKRPSAGIQGNMFSEIKSANINIAIAPISSGPVKFLYITMEPDGDNSTTVKVYTRNPDLAYLTKECVLHDYKECSITK